MATILKEPVIAENLVRKGYTAGLEIKEGERAVIFTVSTSAVDRDKEVILPKGIDLKAYRKNPVVLWAHQYGLPPIAKAQWIKVVDGTLVAKAVFAETPLAEEVYQLLLGEFLRTTSVGFIETEWREPTEKDLKEHPEWTEVKRILSKIELLEFSIVPVPSNRDSLAIAVGKGLKVPKELAEILGGIPPKSEIVSTIKNMGDAQSEEKAKYNCECIKCGYKLTSEKHCKDIKCPKCGGEMRRVERPGPGRSAEYAENKGALPYKETPKAPEDTAWDGPAEVRKAEISDLKIMCAWVDSEHTDIKGGYKLPHHKADGHSVVWKGVAAAMGALMGGRGGVDIPSADRKAVYNHLAKEYKRFDKEPPEFRDAPKLEADEAPKASPNLEPPAQLELATIDKLVERVSAIVSQRESAKLAELVRRYKEARDNEMANEVAKKVIELINVEKMIDERINEAQGRV